MTKQKNKNLKLKSKNSNIVTANHVTRKEHVKALIQKVSAGLFEREEQVAVATLSALAGQNIFLLGPPGTAKSMIARRIRSIFESNRYFECLMHKHLEPTDIFGPISLPKLKNEGQYHRLTEGYLPQADVAFLDEIWKSGPTILNTLLTITNEKVFRNGKEIVNVPLKFLVSASNETPTEEGLEALYDRFAVRLSVPAMENQENFEKLLMTKNPGSFIDCGDLKVTNEQFAEWHAGIQEVELSADTMAVISKIRADIAEHTKRNAADSVEEMESQDESEDEIPETPIDIYVSDRRWVKATGLIKACAYFSGREVTNIADALLLKHCLWTTEENRAKVQSMVENAVREMGFDIGADFNSLLTELRELEHTITKENVYKKDEPMIVEIEGHGDCYVLPHKKGKGYMYANKEKMSNGEKVQAVDINGKPVKGAICAPGNGVAKKPDAALAKEITKMRKDGKTQTIGGKIAHKAGDPVIMSKSQAKKHTDSLNRIQTGIGECVEQIENRKSVLAADIDSPFIMEIEQEIPFEGVNAQLNTLKKEVKKCDLLKAKVKELTFKG